MQAVQLGRDAADFAKYLNAISGATCAIKCEHIPAADVFVNVYQNDLPNGSGVYWFSLPNGEVFYIGKGDAKKKRKPFVRIWAHTYAAKKNEENVWTFPDCVFCTEESYLTALSDNEREDILRGQFRIDYLTVGPGDLADVFEVHLQGVYRLRWRKLPRCNAQYG
jgi:hypothetical protein